MPAMIFLNECTPDTYYVSSVNYPNYTKSFFKLFFLASIEPEDYPKWTWNHKTRKFVKTRTDVLNDQILAKSRLAESKCNIIKKIINNLNSAR
ncbi:MAG: hypothetical protein Q8M92_07280, partial [Candidatus Subteraquimicrobiales bacterium]|nr:hypothetical protein [Candidatus Subteraquimicrobiales bacterium]